MRPMLILYPTEDVMIQKPLRGVQPEGITCFACSHVRPSSASLPSARSDT